MMKSGLLIGFLIATAFAASDAEESIEVGRAGLDQTVKQVIEQIREKLKCGIPEMGIPPLDPLELEHKNFNISFNDTLELHGSLNNVKGKNLLSFKTTHLKASILPISFELGFLWEPIELKGYYDIGGHLLNIIPIYGHGPFEGKFDGVFVYGRIDIGTKAGRLLVKKLEVDFGLKDIKVKIKNLLGATLGDVICQVINENVPTWIEQFKIGYLPGIKNGFVGAINDFLKDKTMDELLELIQGFLTTTTRAPETTTPTLLANLP